MHTTIILQISSKINKIYIFWQYSKDWYLSYLHWPMTTIDLPDTDQSQIEELNHEIKVQQKENL